MTRTYKHSCAIKSPKPSGALRPRLRGREIIKVGLSGRRGHSPTGAPQVLRRQERGGPAGRRADWDWRPAHRRPLISGYEPASAHKPGREGCLDHDVRLKTDIHMLL